MRVSRDHNTDKYGNVYGAGGQSQTYVYRHEQDESTFQLVDTSRPQRSMYRRRPGGMQVCVCGGGTGG